MVLILRRGPESLCDWFQVSLQGRQTALFPGPSPEIPTETLYPTSSRYMQMKPFIWLFSWSYAIFLDAIYEKSFRNKLPFCWWSKYSHIPGNRNYCVLMIPYCITNPGHLFDTNGTNADILSTEHLGTNFNWNLIEIDIFFSQNWVFKLAATLFRAKCVKDKITWHVNVICNPVMLNRCIRIF